MKKILLILAIYNLQVFSMGSIEGPNYFHRLVSAAGIGCGSPIAGGCWFFANQACSAGAYKEAGVFGAIGCGACVWTSLSAYVALKLHRTPYGIELPEHNIRLVLAGLLCCCCCVHLGSFIGAKTACERAGWAASTLFCTVASAGALRETVLEEYEAIKADKKKKTDDLMSRD